tara:strand:- start:504 stop:689 length:186 start_codon:yes stop_codon:yes gene_type:complete
MTDCIKAADLRALHGALEIALKGGREGGPLEREICLEMATEINKEISRRAMAKPQLPMFNC